ncbi:isochorismatase family protein [Solirubrobacter phytolaccae]|uniref:Isochorismatase family protein n=1 Tax=Solirubrobacter phytolaccae TaxID=1404360 RepID=A0A9X3N8Z6_9ACTN|nr:isochorismatase family protein [Solirubrobacter phytolaccae]MDA0181694.1 isochorismatase family protein [Solirubrobacter phytolaccae]
MSGLPTIAPYALPTRERLPENHARWTVAPERAVLLVHDMQDYFVRALPDPLRTSVVANAARLREGCAARGVKVAYTAQPGRMSTGQRGLLMDFWGAGMRTDAADREVVGPLAPAPGDWRLVKWRYSAFFRSDLGARMRACGRDQLILCGVYAHVGLLATALEAFANDIQVFLVADAVGDFSEADQQLALDYVARRCGMVLTCDEVLG